MPRRLIPDTISRACIPARLQPCNQLENPLYAWDRTANGYGSPCTAANHDEKTVTRDANNSWYGDITIQCCPAEKMNER
ncbi:MAG: hypothetical protein JWQ49_4381 [Edaphobacter sp.]|nr:hypothetical protein [Edaphobacter sp.]